MLNRFIVLCLLLTSVVWAAGPFEGVWSDSQNHWLWNFTEKPVWIEGSLDSSAFSQNVYVKKNSATTGEGTATRTDKASGAVTKYNVKITLQDPSHLRLEATGPDGKLESFLLTRKS